MRITDNMRFNTTLRNLFSTQSQYNYLMEKIASQKKVNRASDDPVAATRIINIRQSKAAIEQYMKNIDSSNTWISSTESTLSGVSKLLDSANKIAIGAMGADAATREIAAANIQAIIDSMFSLANTKWGDSYLFSGSKTSTQPFSTVENQPIIGDPAAAGGNVYAGGVSLGAAFTGLTDKTYQVKIVQGGDLGAATYQISSDLGVTWGAVKDDLDTGTIYLGDGIKLTFTPDTFTTDDTFSVNAHADTGIIDAPAAAGGNVYAGTVSSGSYFTGDVNKTYAVKITTDGILNAGGTVITAGTLIKDIDGYTGYSATDYIHLGGTDTVGNAVSDDSLVLSDTTTVGDLLNKIETTFGAAVTATIDAAGKLKLVVVPPSNSLAVEIGVKNSDGSADNTLRFGPAYQFSEDGGRTWNGTDRIMAGDSANLGDGVRMTFDDDAFGTNDIFYVNATAAGYYQGDDENLSMTITRGTNFAYNISGAEAFTEAGGVDIFQTLTALKTALDDNNDSEIYAQRSNIELAGGQILLCQSRCGMKASHLEVVKNNLVQFDETLNFLHSEAQAADVTELGVKLLMSETALKTTYAMAARIGEATILNYLK
jgi:flagellin-like hook-associated protein FlgL